MLRCRTLAATLLVGAGLVLSSVDERYVNVYSVEVGGDRVMSVEIQRPPWLHQKPTVNQSWLRSTLPRAIKSYLRHKPVVKT